MTRLTKSMTAIAVGAMLGFAGSAFAQSGGSKTQSGHDMPGMDMQSMMNQCAQMRQQMQPGARMSADMQRMMRQCDQMDSQMGDPGANTAPRTRTR